MLESAYGACLTKEIQGTGLHFESQVAIPLFYLGVRLEVGYRIDLLVQDQVIVEVKAIEALAAIHRAQVLTYLRLKRCPVGLLLNFNVPLLKNGIVRVLNNRDFSVHAP